MGAMVGMIESNFLTPLCFKKQKDKIFCVLKKKKKNPLERIIRAKEICTLCV
jgi:hypothetical protein